MNTLTKHEENEVVKLMAKEFLECRLGVNTSEKNITRLAEYIVQFEQNVKRRDLKSLQGET